MKPNEGWTGQQTNEWFAMRRGRFTSSEIHRLMGERSLGKDDLSDTAKTYVFEKYGELTTGLSKELKAAALDWGNDNEPLAKDEFEKRHGEVLSDCTFYTDTVLFYFGGSPDGVAIEDGKHSIIEIKCPYAIGEQFKNIAYSKDAKTMRSKYPELYWQMQSNMYLTGLKRGYFISYDPRVKMGNGMYHEMVLERNDEDIAIMLTQIRKAWLMLESIAKDDGIDLIAYLHPDAVRQREENTKRDNSNLSDADKALLLRLHDNVNGSPVTVVDKM